MGGPPAVDTDQPIVERLHDGPRIVSGSILDGVCGLDRRERRHADGSESDWAGERVGRIVGVALDPDRQGKGRIHRIAGFQLNGACAEWFRRDRRPDRSPADVTGRKRPVIRHLGKVDAVDVFQRRGISRLGFGFLVRRHEDLDLDGSAVLGKVRDDPRNGLSRSFSGK